MKLEKWALIAEVVGAFAIVFTLALLLLELRENNHLLERQAGVERAERVSRPFIESDLLSPIMAKIKEVDSDYIGGATRAFMDRYSLSYVEADRFVRYLRFQWKAFEADYLAGITYPDMEPNIAALQSFPDQALYWETAQNAYDPDFVEFVADTVANYGDRFVERQE